MIFKIFGPLNDQMRSMLIIIAFLVVISIILGHKIKKIKPEDKEPKWLVVLENVVGLINDFLKTNMGKWWKSYAPYYFTLAIFLLFANMASVFLLTPPTSYLSVNIGLALISFAIIQIIGVRSNGFFGYLKTFFAPVFIILPINLISEFALPVSLSLRLFGNISSGNVLSMFVEELMGYPSVVIIPALNLIFDIGFGLIQVLVFLLLSMIFASNKVKQEDLIFKTEE